MKVNEFVKNNAASLPKELSELLLQETSIWTNEACYGYCIRAMEHAGMEREQIKMVVSGLRQAFDELTEEEAESVWRKW